MTDDICSFPDCGRPERARDLCASHWAQRFVYEIELRPIHKKNTNPCKADDCDRLELHAHGYCGMHWQRFYHEKPVDRSWKNRGAWPIHMQPVPVRYTTTHSRVRKLWGSAKQYPCIECGADAQDWAYDGTDPDELYLTAGAGRGHQKCSAWPEFYMPMCRKCHRGRDGAVQRQELHEYRAWKNANPGKSLEDVR